MEKGRLLQAGNVFAYVFMIALNAIINVVGFRGENNGSISDKHPTLITPANWAFSIWGLIFAGLALFTIYQALPRHATYSGTLKQVSGLFIANGLINGVWALPFLAKIWWLALVFMLCILGTLIAIYIRTENGCELPQDSKENPYLRYWCVEFPFSVYLGWISVATVVNTAVFFKYTPAISWNFNETVPTCIMICVILVLGSLNLVLNRDVAYAGVFVWSTWAISVYQTDPAVVITAQVVFGILLAGCIAALPYRLYFGRRKRKTPKTADKEAPLSTIKNATPPESKIKIDSDNLDSKNDKDVSPNTSKVGTNQVVPGDVV